MSLQKTGEVHSEAGLARTMFGLLGVALPDDAPWAEVDVVDNGERSIIATAGLPSGSRASCPASLRLTGHACEVTGDRMIVWPEALDRHLAMQLGTQAHGTTSPADGIEAAFAVPQLLKAFHLNEFDDVAKLARGANVDLGDLEALGRGHAFIRYVKGLFARVKDVRLATATLRDSSQGLSLAATVVPIRSSELERFARSHERATPVGLELVQENPAFLLFQASDTDLKDTDDALDLSEDLHAFPWSTVELPYVTDLVRRVHSLNLGGRTLMGWRTDAGKPAALTVTASRGPELLDTQLELESMLRARKIAADQEAQTDQSGAYAPPPSPEQLDLLLEASGPHEEDDGDEVGMTSSPHPWHTSWVTIANRRVWAADHGNQVVVASAAAPGIVAAAGPEGGHVLESILLGQRNRETQNWLRRKLQLDKGPWLAGYCDFAAARDIGSELAPVSSVLDLVTFDYWTVLISSLAQEGEVPPVSFVSWAHDGRIEVTMDFGPAPSTKESGDVFRSGSLYTNQAVTEVSHANE